MNSLGDLETSLAELQPSVGGDYIYASVEAIPPGLTPFATVAEPSGLTLVVEAAAAKENGLDSSELFSRISLGVDTSLNAVGITATIAQTLASRDIPCNVIAGFYQDHLFIPANKAEDALRALESLRQQAQGWQPR